MMTRNPLLGQVLGGVFGRALAKRGVGGLGGSGLGGVGGVALGSVLGGMLGRRGGMAGVPAGRAAGGGGRTALLMMLLPLAMRWVQNNGGVGAVLKRFQQQGYAKQARSWLEPGENQPLDEQAVQQVVGDADIQQMAEKLGVPPEQVAQAFAEIMPEMVDQLTPQGELAHADEVLDEGRQTLEKEIEDVKFRESA